jgi:hypothetical protein
LAEGVMTSDNIMKGISIDHWLVLFGHKGLVNERTGYSIMNKDKKTNLLLDMKPEGSYLIDIIKGGSESNKEKVVASKQGTLFFATTGPCRVEITPF